MSGFGGFGGGGGSDPFTKFWSEMTNKMGSSGFGMPFDGSNEAAMKAMRQAFFDSWSHHCEEFMRSPMFLDAMKQSMDSALTFREQVNSFLNKALQESQVPTRRDTDSILQVLRGLEERVLDQLQSLSKRVDAMETRTGKQPVAGGEVKHAAKGGSR